MKNKRGIAPLIATVLLIVIVIAAAAIIWTVIVPFIKEQTESAQACMNTIGMEIDFQWTCWDIDDEDNKFLQFKIIRDSKEFELVDIIAKISYADGSVTKRLVEDFDLVLPINVLEEKVYKINYYGSSPDPSWGLDEDTEIISIAIAPVIQLGTIEKICDIVSSVPVESCAP
jgi:flagellin-like protein